MIKGIKTGGGWAGLIIGAFFSVLGGFVVYFWTLSQKEPVYSKNSVNYISDFSSAITDLKVFYNNEAVKNLTRTKLVFLNLGKTPINGSEIAKKDRLRIYSDSDNVKILSLNKIFQNRNVFDVKIEKNEKNEYFIDFDFLDKDDGFIFQIIHNGVDDKNIKISGTIIGSKEITEVKLVKRKTYFLEAVLQSKTNSNERFNVDIVLSGILAVVISIYFQSQIFKRQKNDEKNMWSLPNPFLILILILIFIAIFNIPYISNSLESIFSKVMPVGYEVFFQ